MFEHSIDPRTIERASPDARRACPGINEQRSAEAHCRLSMPFRMTRRGWLNSPWTVPRLVEAFAALLQPVSDPALRVDAIDADRSSSGLVAAGRGV